MSRPFVPPAAVLLALAVAACNGTPAAPTVAPTPAPTPVPTPEPTPTPAPPQDPGNIASVRVAFYGVVCTNGQQAPNNTARKLPVGCTGYVTATPKQADGTDVRAEDHGPDITWELLQGELQVRVIDDERQPFNKQVKGRRPGDFSLCATVKTVRGCLNAEVIA